MVESKQYSRGVPTGPDVDRMVENFGAVPEGESVPCADIEDVLGVRRDQSRYRTVMAAFRRRMFHERNVDIEGNGEGGFVVNTPERRIARAGKMVETGRRVVGRAVLLACQTDASRLPDDCRAERERISSIGQRKIDMAAAVMP